MIQLGLASWRKAIEWSPGSRSLIYPSQPCQKVGEAKEQNPRLNGSPVTSKGADQTGTLSPDSQLHRHK